MTGFTRFGCSVTSGLRSGPSGIRQNSVNLTNSGLCEQAYLRGGVDGDQWLDTWLASNGRGWRPATRASYLQTLVPVHKALGRRRVQELRKEHIETMVTALGNATGRGGQKLSPRSVAYALTLLQL